MKSPVSISKDTQERPELIVNAIPDWDGFEKLALFLQNKYLAEISEKNDGPDARRWKLIIEGHNFELLHNDPYYNALILLDRKGHEVFKRIAEDLAMRLEGI